MVQKTKFSIFVASSLTVGLLIGASFLAPAQAQDIVPEANRGVPQDWSHRHVVIRDAETMKQASGKGVVAFQRWKERLRDPRFTMAVARKTIDVQPTANKMFSGQQLAFFDRFDRKPKNSSLKRDWTVALGNTAAVDGSGTGTGVGTAGIFPAKYTWDINATPSCTNDFIVYSTMTPGSTSGTSARQIATFGGTGATTDSIWNGLNGGAGTMTITNGANSITLVAQNSVTATSNSGLNFYVGASTSSNSRAFWAYNLAAAINRNGNTVGVSATSSDGVVTIVANAAGTAGNAITLASTTALNNFFFTLGGNNLAGGTNAGAGAQPQPTLVAYNQLYKTTCTTGTGAVAAGSPNIFWSYNTGNGAIVETSPALSLDGTQVAFVQRTSAPTATTTTPEHLNPGQTAHLVLLKWKAGTAGAHAATVAPTEVAPSGYRGCNAPCMTKFALGANNQNSSPYVDYANDRIYVGDAYGRLHRFEGVFNGLPAAAANWPVLVSSGNMLSSPVFDSVSNQVFVGSDVSEVVGAVGDPYTGGYFHRVDADNRAVVNSAQIGAQTAANASSRSKMTGVRDGAVLDSAAQKVYAFLETDTKVDCGSTQTASSCKAVYQFNTLFAAGYPSNDTEIAASGRQFGRGQIAGRVTYVGQFDDAYWSSNPASPTGNLYVCGSGNNGDVSRRPTLFRIPITNNVFGTAVPLVELTTDPVSAGDVGASCSPVTIIKNGSNEYLYIGVSAFGNQTGCSGTAGQDGCIYMMQLQGASPNSDVTSTPAVAVNTNDRFISVSTATSVSTTEGPVLTTRTSAATFTGMTITQSQANPSGGTAARTIQYWLRKNGADTAITCTVPAGGTTCPASGSVSYAIGDTISVRFNRSGTGSSTAMTFRVQLTGSGSNLTTPAAGLPASGGTGGIVVDNVSSVAGASQVYYANRKRPGRAVQASQAGLN